jgi:thiol-disulfide isomerase/thioredoxin
VTRTIKRLSAAWLRFRSSFWLSLAFDAFVIMGVFVAVHSWQTRDLPLDEPAPETVLALLDGSGFRPAVSPGEKGIVYFFAPWCFYCRHSIGNLDALVSKGAVAWGTVVALDYSDTDEVQAFIEKTEVSLPVLMGNAKTATDWGVRAFPTYYVIDGEGRISSRSVGYSTGVGMAVRAWMAQ